MKILPNFLVKEPTAEVVLFDGDEESTIRLWPISARLLLRLKSVGKPIIQALTELLSPPNTSRTEERTQKLEDGFSTEEVTNPINPDLYEVVCQKREARVTKIIDALLDEKTFDLMVEILVDSMRDHADQKKELAAQLGTLQLPVLVNLCKGILEANKEVFDPLKSMLPEDFVSRTKKSFEQRLEQTEEMASPEMTPTPSPTEVDPTSHSLSETPSMSLPAT